MNTYYSNAAAKEDLHANAGESDEFLQPDDALDERHAAAGGGQVRRTPSGRHKQSGANDGKGGMSKHAASRTYESHSARAAPSHAGNQGSGQAGHDGAGKVEEPGNMGFRERIEEHWRPRMIGHNGVRIRRIIERLGGNIKFGKGVYSTRIHVFGTAEQQKNLWIALQEEMAIEHMRDKMENMRAANKPREVLMLFNDIQRACTASNSPMFVLDYHSALAACIQIFQVHRSVRIFLQMCLDKDVSPTPRTFGFICRAAVMSGDLNPLLDKLELARMKCGITVEHALRDVEISLMELNFPRVKVAMQVRACVCMYV
jgi:hypothetical protein